MEFKLYRCAHCGNIVFKVVDKGVPIMCCGEKMQELIPNTTDAATEKHVPMVEKVSHGGGFQSNREGGLRSPSHAAGALHQSHCRRL